MKLLFLCSQNKRRSLTAEKIFGKMKEYEVRSAGTENNARVKVTAGMIGWAEVVFCMEKKHVRRIKEKYADVLVDKKVICLNIADDYGYMDEELVDVLEAGVEGFYLYCQDYGL